MRSCKEPPPPRTRLGPRSVHSHAPTSNLLNESEAITMPVQTKPENHTLDLTSIGDAAQELFSTAATPEEVAALRDELLRRVAECANAARREIAEEAERKNLGE